ncbi:MAG TPA: TolC family protein [Bryobacteraceae bacterium]|jgi:outer membrane protein TolC
MKIPAMWLLRPTLKTERGAKLRLTRLAVRAAFSALFCALTCAAQTRTLTLRQALDLALQQNPDMVIARLDEQRARDQETINKDPFSPKVFAGSGAAWTYGFPTSIDGSAPSIVQAKTNMALFDRPQTYLVAQAKELARGAGITLNQRQAEVVYRVASLFVDAQNAAHGLGAAKQERDNLASAQRLTQTRFDEGQALELEPRKAKIAEDQAEHRVVMFGRDLSTAERSLGMVLGLAPGDKVQVADAALPALEPPISEDEAIAGALENSPEVKRLESDLLAKSLEIKSYRANRLPKADLVAQYSLLGKYNNYTEFFNHFQRNNVELGASVSIPILAGHSAKAYVSQAEADAAKIRTEIERTRRRIRDDIENAFDDLHVADDSRTLALEDLNVTRESTTLDLSRQSEGLILPVQIEQDRAEEQEKWRAYYDAQALAQHARLNVLRLTGTLEEALK